jgi:NitT/TauT family transport system substrate-binding protein
MPFFGHWAQRLTAGAIALGISVGSACAADVKNVRIMMDWLVQGTHAPFVVAQTKGYFDPVNVTVEAGKGATNVAVAVASGVDQFGLVDLPALILFNAKNPTKPLVGVYMYFDETPLAIISRKSAGIKTPADLEGKKIAGGPGTAGHDTIAMILKPDQQAKVTWVPVAPQLFGAMLIKGEVAGLGGFTNSQIPAALEAGVKMEDIAALKYSDFGANLYGMALVTTKEFLDANPDTVRTVVKGLNHGILDTIADPDAALKTLQARDAMMNMNIEKVRLGIALDLINTAAVKKNGLSAVQPARLKETIDSVSGVFALEKPPAPDSLYTAAYLPPQSERVVKAPSN